MDGKDLECLFLNGGHVWEIYTNYETLQVISIRSICIKCKKVKIKTVNTKDILENLKKQSYISNSDAPPEDIIKQFNENVIKDDEI